jgi:hypothetical protein
VAVAGMAGPRGTSFLAFFFDFPLFLLMGVRLKEQSCQRFAISAVRIKQTKTNSNRQLRVHGGGKRDSSRHRHSLEKGNPVLALPASKRVYERGSKASCPWEGTRGAFCFIRKAWARRPCYVLLNPFQTAS